MLKKTTKITNNRYRGRTPGYSGILNIVGLMILLSALIFTGCKKDNFKAVQGVCPLVTTDPMDKAVDVVLGKVITATFNTTMDPATINKTTFIIMQGATPVSGTIAASASGTAFTFTPDAPLLPFVVYTGTITTADR